MEDQLQSDVCARYLKALSEPDRLKIIQCLQAGPRNVSEIAALIDRDRSDILTAAKKRQHPDNAQKRADTPTQHNGFSPKIAVRKQCSKDEVRAYVV